MDKRAENIVADLRTYLRQQEESGKGRLYVDEEWLARIKEITAPAVETSPGAAAVGDLADALRAPAGSELFEPGAGRGSVDRTSELSPAEKKAALAQLDASEVSGCVKCKLHTTRTNTVFGVGNPDANLVFVGEAPGRDEDLKGEPFVGAAGQLLTKILGAIGFERDDVYICNVLKCRPPQNRDPEVDEVDACEPYLQRQLDIIQPKIICALGRHAAHTLLDTNQSLGRMRSHVHDYYGIPTVVTYHPAALLRNPQWKRPTWEDVQKLRAMHDRLVADK